MKTLPDHLRKGMKLVIVGCNPTESSVRTGHYYSGRDNPFWPTLYETGVIPEPLEYRDDKRIIEFAIGLTDLVKRPTRAIEELTREDYAEGRIVLSQKLGEFVPHVSVTVTLGLMVADLAVLIYFIHHTAVSIQLPQVIAGIAADLAEAIREQGSENTEPHPKAGPTAAELVGRTEEGGAVLLAPASGYLQFIKHRDLVRLATQANAVINLEQRPGHFMVHGHRFATVWPPEAAPLVRQALGRAHIVGPHRTLSQDVSFGIDQLVEIALRALSAAVNDTFTALTCIDWLGENLCKIVAQWHPARVHRDDRGYIRVIAAEPSYDRLVQRSFEKLRQSSLGQPAVMIRLLDALARIMAETTSEGQRRVLLEQAEMINRACERSVPEAGDRADIQRRYEAVLTLESRLTATGRNA